VQLGCRVAETLVALLDGEDLSAASVGLGASGGGSAGTGDFACGA
jgi:hypothetical protein